MSTLIIDHRDVSLVYEEHCLIIRQPQQAPRSVPLQGLERILCLHNLQLDTRLLGHCQRLGIDFIVLNSRHSELSFAVHANHLHQAQRRSSQYRLSCIPEQALHLVRLLVSAKLGQGLVMLRREDAGTEQQQALLSLACQRAQLRHATSADSLRGMEGAAQQALFAYWRQCLPAHLGFQRRQRRPPPDPVNALLSLTYTLVYHEAIRQCLAHGLDPWLGLYHCPMHNRQSMACDLMEPLRPAVELWVVERFRQGDFDNRHFSRQDAACLFGKAGRERFYPLWYQQQGLWAAKLARYAAWLARHLNQP
ncbi:CRISPR-associated protein Cas4/endonuclease Cas1 fusion [compost metagenome]